MPPQPWSLVIKIINSRSSSSSTSGTNCKCAVWAWQGLVVSQSDILLIVDLIWYCSGKVLVLTTKVFSNMPSMEINLTIIEMCVIQHPKDKWYENEIQGKAENVICILEWKCMDMNTVISGIYLISIQLFKVTFFHEFATTLYTEWWIERFSAPDPFIQHSSTTPCPLFSHWSTSTGGWD